MTAGGRGVHTQVLCGKRAVAIQPQLPDFTAGPGQRPRSRERTDRQLQKGSPAPTGITANRKGTAPPAQPLLNSALTQLPPASNSRERNRISQPVRKAGWEAGHVFYSKLQSCRHQRRFTTRPEKLQRWSLVASRAAARLLVSGSTYPDKDTSDSLWGVNFLTEA